MDSGPMGFFYKGRVPPSRREPPRSRLRMTIEAAASSRRSALIAADSGDGSFYDAMVWLAGGQPFHVTSADVTVTIDLDEDAGTQRFTEFWRKWSMRACTASATWSDRWKSRVGTRHHRLRVLWGLDAVAAAVQCAGRPVCGAWLPCPPADGQACQRRKWRLGADRTITVSRMRPIVSWTLWRMTPKALARV